MARCLGGHPGSAGVSAASSKDPASAGETPALPGYLSAEQLIALIENSGLRGRGGAGFPTAAKWRLARAQPGETKYVICNGDEGDPGAFMDRMLLESFPFRVIEGLAIAAVAGGAPQGLFFIPSAYPFAPEPVPAAL